MFFKPSWHSCTEDRQHDDMSINNNVHTSDSEPLSPNLDLPKTRKPQVLFPTNKEDDSAVALPLIHRVDLLRSWRKAVPEVFDEN